MSSKYKWIDHKPSFCLFIAAAPSQKPARTILQSESEVHLRLIEAALRLAKYNQKAEKANKIILHTFHNLISIQLLMKFMNY